MILIIWTAGWIAAVYLAAKYSRGDDATKRQQASQFKHKIQDLSFLGVIVCLLGSLYNYSRGDPLSASIVLGDAMFWIAPIVLGALSSLVLYSVEARGREPLLEEMDFGELRDMRDMTAQIAGSLQQIKRLTGSLGGIENLGALSRGMNRQIRYILDNEATLSRAVLSLQALNRERVSADTLRLIEVAGHLDLERIEQMAARLESLAGHADLVHDVSALVTTSEEEIAQRLDVVHSQLCEITDLLPKVEAIWQELDVLPYRVDLTQRRLAKALTPKR